LVELRQYEGWENDWTVLPTPAKEQLAELLERLQANPYDPEIQVKADLGPDEVMAYRLPDDYVFYWRIESDPQPLVITRLPDTGRMRIIMLGLEQIKR
jgi:hypothetical protein